MATQVIGVRSQFTPFQDYVAGASICACGSCSAFSPTIPCNVVDGIIDWYYASVYCCFTCPYQQRCSRPDPNICPVIGGTRGTVRWNSNDDSGNFQQQGRQARCEYNVTDFKEAADLTAWINAFGENDVYNNIIMPYYCPQTAATGTCPIFPPLLTGTGTACPAGLTGCSRLSATNQDGQLCRAWAASNVTLGQVAGANFCSANTCANDCKCYNRENVDPLYILITESPGAPPPTTDACWYQPCQQSPPFLIPANQIIGTGTCPTTVCQQVVNIIGNQGSNINIDIARQDISCTFAPAGPTGGGNPSYIKTIWEQYRVWIIAGTAIFVVIIVLIVIIALVRRAHSNDTGS